MSVSLRSVSVTAPTPTGELTILHPTTLSLTEQRISIIGGNGSGKSTLARLCNGLVEPTTGTVEITRSAGTPVTTHAHGAAVRRTVGFMFTDPAAQLIMPTAIEDVALSLRRTVKSTSARTAAARATLARFGLGDLADRSVHTLSGGQKQLLALASVLAADPEILVADEPTTLLDLRNSHRIADVLFGLAQQLILVTHDLELAARADRTLVVADGRIAYDGHPAAAIAHYRDTVARAIARGHAEDAAGHA